MAREAIKLSWEPVGTSGKGRYRKTFRKKRWHSQVYPCRSRRNESNAWKHFVRWREQTKRDIDAKQQAEDEADPVRANVVEALQEEIAYSETVGDSSQAKWARDVLETVRKTDQLGVYQAAALLGIPDPGEEEPEYEAARNILRHTIKKGRDRRQETQPQFETEKLVEQWLLFRLGDVRSHSITVGTLDNNRLQLKSFTDFCPDIRDVDELKFLEFRAKLQEKIAEGASPFTQRDTLATVKNFLEWCGDTAKVIEPITNLRKRGTGIKVPTKRIITVWDVATIKKLLKTVEGQQKLYSLLILNTGAYESDIGTWTHVATDDRGREFRTFDEDSGTITFKRHKEKDEPNVPTVTYKLWDETARLLTKFVSDHPTLLLTTSRGTPLWKDELKSDTTKQTKRTRKNVIGRQFGRLKANNPEFGTLDDLRKTAISKLDDHGEYARYSQYFAGHSPQGTTDRFYRRPSQEQFDQAVIWLGEQFGETTSR